MAIKNDLPPLRDIVKKYNLKTKKVLSQNFIFDLNVTHRIARSAGSLIHSHIIEIGAGLGSLTRSLLQEGAKKVTVIEADERFKPVLEELATLYPGQLEIIIGDALKINPQDLVEDSYKIIANLPYNIATALLIKWFKQTPISWESLTLMFQKEVAQRICAPPHTSAYGRLSVLVGWLSEARILFDLPPQVFTPPPKVTSTLVHITPRTEPLAVAHIKYIEKVTACTFNQKRKMLRSSLKKISNNPIELIKQAGLKPTQRAETLSIEDFCKLAYLLEKS